MIILFEIILSYLMEIFETFKTPHRAKSVVTLLVPLDLCYCLHFLVFIIIIMMMMMMMMTMMIMMMMIIIIMIIIVIIIIIITIIIVT